MRNLCFRFLMRQWVPRVTNMLFIDSLEGVAVLPNLEHDFIE